jgi:hypothetical protein
MAFYPPPLHDLDWRIGDRLDPRPPRIRREVEIRLRLLEAAPAEPAPPGGKPRRRR